jgi:hypothetical protein
MVMCRVYVSNKQRGKVTDQEKSTIAELAEVIADQNERIRILTEELDEQSDIIVQYELDKENEERYVAEFYNELFDITEGKTRYDDPVTALIDVLDKYFDGRE